MNDTSGFQEMRSSIFRSPCLAFRSSRRFNSEQVSVIFHHPMPLGIAKRIKNAYLSVCLKY